MEFESTEKKKAPSSRVCIIYDPRDGRIIHGHEFVGDGAGMFGPDGREEREQQTLEGARRNHGDVSKLRVLHAPTNFRFTPNAAYRVDVKSSRLVEHARWTPENARPATPPVKRAGTRKKKP